MNPMRWLRRVLSNQPDLPTSSLPDSKDKSKKSAASGEVSKRIIVLGSSIKAPGVIACDWEDLPPKLNVADCDVLVVNLVPFYDPEFGKGLSAKTLTNLPTSRDFWRHLFSPNTETIVMGSPNEWIGDPEAYRENFGRSWGYNSLQRTDWWQPPNLPYQTDSKGETVSACDKGWAFYLDKVKRWRHYFSLSKTAAFNLHDHFFKEVCPQGNSTKALVTPLAKNRQGESIAFRFDLAIGRLPEDRLGRVSEGHPADPLKLSSSLVVLPPTTTIDSFEAVELILAERYGVAAVHETPHWVESFLLPEQQSLKVDLDAALAESKRLSLHAEDLRQQLTASLRLQRILYGTGDELEGLTRELVTMLGATVTNGPHKFRDDGRLTVQGLDGQLLMMEVKGRQKSLKLEDIRQLAGWVGMAGSEEKIKVTKGLVVGCGHTDYPPNERQCIFPDNAVKEACLHDFCLLTTSQLLQAVHRFQKGELTQQKFWESVVKTKGLFAD